MSRNLPFKPTNPHEYRCAYCGTWMVASTKHTPPWRGFSWQHVLPRRRGGTDDPSNLRPCCRGCNTDLAHPVVDDCPAALACWRALMGDPEPGGFAIRAKLLMAWAAADAQCEVAHGRYAAQLASQAGEVMFAATDATRSGLYGAGPSRVEASANATSRMPRDFLRPRDATWDTIPCSRRLAAHISHGTGPVVWHVRPDGIADILDA